MTQSVRRSINRSISLSVGWSVCHNFLEGREVTLPCSYRNTCFANKPELKALGIPRTSLVFPISPTPKFREWNSDDWQNHINICNKSLSNNFPQMHDRIANLKVLNRRRYVFSHYSGNSRVYLMPWRCINVTIKLDNRSLIEKTKQLKIQINFPNAPTNTTLSVCPSVRNSVCTNNLRLA